MSQFQPEAELEPWQLAVKLDVLMCCPNDAARRLRLENAIGAQLVEVTLLDLPKSARQAGGAIAAAKYPDYDAEARRRISDRFVVMHEEVARAGAVFLSLTKKAATGNYPTFLSKDRQPTVAEAVQHMLRMEGQPSHLTAVHTFFQRKVRPYYRVAHLAGAFQLMAKAFAENKRVMAFDYQDSGLCQTNEAGGSDLE